MGFTAFFADILKLTISGLIVFTLGWVYVREYLNKRFNFELLQLKSESIKHTLPLRLQAYERMVLLLERINPSSLLIRLHQPGLSAREMQNIIVAEVNAEYQHNITQQLYVSPATWAIAAKMKTETINLLNNVANALPESATAVDLNRAILMHLAGLESENPYEVAVNAVKREAAHLF